MERDEHHKPTSLPAPTKNTSIMQVRLSPHTPATTPQHNPHSDHCLPPPPPPSSVPLCLPPPPPPPPPPLPRPPPTHRPSVHPASAFVPRAHRSTGRPSRRSGTSNCSRSIANATWRETRRPTLLPGCASGGLSTHRSTSTSSCSRSRARCGPRDLHNPSHKRCALRPAPVAHVAHHPASSVQPHTTPHTPSGADARVAARGPHRARLAAQPLGLRGDALRLCRLRLHLPRPRRRRQLTSRTPPL